MNFLQTRTARWLLPHEVQRNRFHPAKTILDFVQHQPDSAAGKLLAISMTSEERTPMFTIQDLHAARDLVHRHMPATPQFAWPLLGERLGTELWVKHENHTPTGAFKVRGGLVYLDELTRSQPDCPGIVTATRGNHGQSIPFAARAFGIPVEVLVPKGNSVEKNAAMRGWGAKVETFGDDFEDARQEAVRRGEEDGKHIIGPFHEPLVRGVATYALEFFEAAPALDVVYVPIGMGSGCCGLITVRDLLGLKTEIVGVVSTGADAYGQSFEAGRVVSTNTTDTVLADGMDCRAPWAEPVEIIHKGCARVVRVSDDEIAEAMRLYYTGTHNIAEGAGAAPLAAALQESDRLAGKTVGVILSGGNVDADLFSRVLSGETPRRGASA
jgi:threonine dehydratase